jgi:LysM repeat protein
MMRKSYRTVIAGVVLVLAALACSLSGDTSPSPTAPITVFAPTLAISPSPLVLTAQAATAAQPAVVPAVTNTSPALAAPVTTVSNPVVAGTCTQPAGWVTYTVQVGDSVSLIAERAATTTDQLISANCLANADVINAGQVIYVPVSIPGPQTGSNAGSTVPAAGNASSGGSGPSVENVWVEPAVVQNDGQYVVTNGTTITVRARRATNAARVTFVLQPIGSNAAPTTLGVDTNLADGISITWTVNDPNLRANLWAIATSSTNESTQTTPIVVVSRQP